MNTNENDRVSFDLGYQDGADDAHYDEARSLEWFQDHDDAYLAGYRAGQVEWFDGRYNGDSDLAWTRYSRSL